MENISVAISILTLLSIVGGFLMFIAKTSSNETKAKSTLQEQINLHSKDIEHLKKSSLKRQSEIAEIEKEKRAWRESFNHKFVEEIAKIKALIIENEKSHDQKLQLSLEKIMVKINSNEEKLKNVEFKITEAITTFRVVETMMKENLKKSEL